jgi:predicted TIM-barrel fold metal-dependent hydrolase
MDRRSEAKAARRIDVHHHLCPPGYADEVNKIVPLFAALRDWTPERSIEDMDEGGVETAILSMSTPGVWFGDRDAARRLARTCNDYIARLASDHPGRFGFFATLPMPDVEGSLREIEYALDALKADGVCLMTSYGTRYLGEPEFLPVLTELNRRSAVIYTHPTISPCCVNLLPIVSEAIIEYGTDTTRTIASLLFSGTAARLRDAKFIFSHAGGTMPYLIGRFLQHVRNKPDTVNLPNGVIPEVRRHFYDTAQSCNPTTMAALRQLVDASQILFGTDFPWGRAAFHAGGLDDCGFTADELRQICRGNAAKLLGLPHPA